MHDDPVAVVLRISVTESNPTAAAAPGVIPSAVLCLVHAGG